MKKLIALLLLAALGLAGLAASATREHKQIVLLRTYISTNQIPGYVVGFTNGYAQIGTPGRATWHEPRTEVVTNYVLGFLDGDTAVELITLKN